LPGAPISKISNELLEKLKLLNVQKYDDPFSMGLKKN
jgi:hypothetical protein